MDRSVKQLNKSGKFNNMSNYLCPPKACWSDPSKINVCGFLWLPHLGHCHNAWLVQNKPFWCWGSVQNKLADIPGEPDGLSAPGVFSRPCTSHSVPEDMCLGSHQRAQLVKTQSSCLGSQRPGQMLPWHLQRHLQSCRHHLSQVQQVHSTWNCPVFPPETAYFKNFSNPVCLLTEHSCLGKSAENLIPQGDRRGGFQTPLMVSPPHLEHGFQEGPIPFHCQCWMVPH